MYTTGQKVHRFLELAIGEDYYDYETITGVLDGYAEPGYSSMFRDDDVVVLGNWNNKRSAWRAQEEGRPLTPEETLPSRLAESLERLGASVEWYDEWTECRGCWRAVRTNPDSYSWKPSYTLTGDGPICHECAVLGGEDYLTDYINDPAKCVTWCDASHLEAFGYVKWEPGSPRDYQSGWHPHQTDDPKVVFDEITDAHPDAEVIFYLDESSQFYIGFSAYVRMA